MDAAGAPAGVVTFLLTDVVASTRLWRESPLAGAALARHAELIAAAVARHGGVRPPDQGEGDSTLAAFERPAHAVAAALEAQIALVREEWPEGAEVSVRIAVHTGEAERREAGNYGGLAIIRAARIRSHAHGGQILVSNAAAGLVDEDLPEGASLVELGSVALPGFARAERLHELTHADLPVHGRLGAVRAVPSTTLRPWPTSLVGRERELRELDELLVARPVVTITGAGGSGKTRLAHAVAEDCVDHHADGVVWVELARLSDPAQVVPAVLAACGLMEIPGADALHVLTSRLARAELLIVLDNCEHLLPSCAALAEAAVRAGPGVRVLATSREPLGAAGETTWRIPSLAAAPEHELSVERIAEFDAVRLFVERASAARPDFRLDTESAPLVARICRRLDGIPLALELAAARLRALSLERLADGLDDRFRLLTGGARTAVARQRTLLASVEWSHSLLEPAEQALFGRLAVFAAPFSLDAAEWVGADEDLDRLEVFDLLARLVDKSLVQHADEHYWLLETLRQYGLEHGDPADLTRARDRHLAWFQRRAEGWAVEREILSLRSLAEIAAERPDLVAAVEWSLRPGRAPALELLHPLGALWPWQGAFAEAGAVMDRVLARFVPGSPQWLEALAPAADALFMGGRIAPLPAARSGLLEHGDSLPLFTRSRLESALGWALLYMNQPDGFQVLEQAIQHARSAGSHAAEVMAATQLAVFLTDRGRLQPLLAWLDRQVAADSSLRDQVDYIAGNYAMQECDFATARALFSGRHPGNLMALAFLASLTGDRGPLRHALARAAQIGDFGVFQGSGELIAGVSAILDGDFAKARAHLSAVSGGGLFATIARGFLFEVTLELGERREAETLLVEMEHRTADTYSSLQLAKRDESRALLARGRNPAEAETAARAALVRLVQSGLVGPQVEALEVLALVMGDAGQLLEAGRWLGAADAFRARTGYYRWFLRPAFEELRQKAGTAALEEGARLSIEEAIAYAQRGHGERGRPAHGWDSLTPTEARVVELVAEGLPNKEIAAKLFVSVATVKTHLLHVYGKLEVRTRADLAAQAALRTRSR